MKKSLSIRIGVVFTLIMIILQCANGLFLRFIFLPNILNEFEYKFEEKFADKIRIDDDYIIIEKDIFKDILVHGDLLDSEETFQTSSLIKISSSAIALNIIKLEMGGILIGIIIITFAIRIVIKPLKEVTAATTEVAKGNFDIQLEERSLDEVGQLINNFNKMTKELRNLDYLRKDFVSSVSHEFKTPITSIQGFIFLLRDRELPDEEYFDYINIITKETKRLSHLSSNLLMLSHLDNINFDYEKNKYRLDEQIRSAILLLETKWQEKEIIFDIEMDNVEIYSNEELLMQVWINLIDNAIKFSDDNNQIDINIRDHTESITISITDYGKGIEEHNLSKIFERFYKDDNSRSTDGNGLGLSIVKKIIDLIGGEVKCNSVLGEYTSFIITIYK